MTSTKVAEIALGDRFNTTAETGCIAIMSPDRDGNFDGIDSDGVLVQFNVRQILPNSFIPARLISYMPDLLGEMRAAEANLRHAHSGTDPNVDARLGVSADVRWRVVASLAAAISKATGGAS